MIGSNGFEPSYVMEGEVNDEVIHGNCDYIVKNCRFLFLFSSDMK